MQFNPNPKKQAQEVIFSKKAESNNSLPLTFNKTEVRTCQSQKHLGLILKWKSKTRVTSYELRVQIYELRVPIHELRVQIHELRAQIHELRVQIHELRVQVHELRVQIYEFKFTNH